MDGGDGNDDDDDDSDNVDDDYADCKQAVKEVKSGILMRKVKNAEVERNTDGLR